jgi:hypothetical protein
VLPRLDYCNADFTSSRNNQLDGLHAVLKTATRLTLSAFRCHHMTPLLEQLHWLPMSKRREFKLCTLAYQCLKGMALA